MDDLKLKEIKIPWYERFTVCQECGGQGQVPEDDPYDPDDCEYFSCKKCKGTGRGRFAWIYDFLYWMKSWTSH